MYIGFRKQFISLLLVYEQLNYSQCFEEKKYCRVDYVLKEENGTFNVEILNKSYDNVVGPAGQS